MKHAIFLFFMLLLASAGRAVNFTVTNSNDSGPGSLRQAVLDANANGTVDTITFNTAGHFSVPRTITLSSAIYINSLLTITAPSAAAQQVTVSGGDAVRVFSVHLGLPGGTVRVENLRVVDGFAERGAGFDVTGVAAILHLVDCVLVGNVSSLEGGGLYLNDASAILERVNFSGNEAVRGGGLWMAEYAGVTVTATDCTFFGNEAREGGALFIEKGTLTMEKTLISSNTAKVFGGGGGVYIGYHAGVPTATFRECTFASNNSSGVGGGLYMKSNGNLTVTDCTFSNNDAQSGAGVMLDNDLGTSVWLNCTFSGNDAAKDGGGFFIDGSFAAHTLTNCTFSANTALEEAGAIYADGSSTIDLLNCTITRNSAPSGGGIYTTPWNNVSLGNCIVAGNTGGDADVNGLVLSRGNNFIGNRQSATNAIVSIGLINGVNNDNVGSNASPLDPRLGPLVNNGGLTNTHQLLVDSPCLDAGKNSLITNPPFIGNQDQRGQPRIAGAKVDIGAYEFPALEVTNTLNSGGGSLRDVLAQAMAAGGGVITFRESTFGGSKQTITLGSQLSVTGDVSIIAPEVGVRLNGNDAVRLFNITAGTVVLKRLELDEGRSGATGGAIRAQGAGVKLTLKECIVRDSTASGNGGGIYFSGEALTVNKTLVHNNEASAGGGIYVHSGASLILTNSTVSANMVTGGGGGIFFDHAGQTSTIINSTVTLNACDTDTNNAGNGGGFFVNGGTVRVGNSIVAENSDALAGTTHHDASGTFTTLGNNLLGTGFGATGFTHNVNGDKVGTNASPIDPLLGPLGAGVAYIPSTSSPAVDAGNNSLLSNPVWLGYPEFDQRGQFRVFNGTVDIGSVEVPTAMVVRMSVVDTEGNEQGGDVAKFRFTRTIEQTAATITVTIHSSSTAAATDYTLSGASYVALSPTTFQITFPAQDEAITLTVTPVNDALVEGTETLTLALTGAGHTLDPGSVNLQSVSIRDSDFLVTSRADSGAGSLRDALAQANANEGGNVTFKEGVCEIKLSSGPLTISEDVDIIGDVTLDAQGLSHVITIHSTGLGCSLLKGLTITGGNATPASGGGLKISDGCVEIRECSITRNAATFDGGGLYAIGGTTRIYNSSIDNNSAAKGGGIHATSGAFVLLTNVTVAKNTAIGSGGGAYVIDSELSLTNVTMTDNLCDSNNDGSGDGGGCFADADSRVIFKNSAITGNQDTPNNAGSGSIHSNIGALQLTSLETQGNNFVGRNTGVSSVFPQGIPNANGDYAGTAGSPLSAQLTEISIAGPLHYTFPTTSFLHNAGNNAGVVEPKDQRLRTRIRGLAVDIGAVELNPLVVTNANNAGAGSLRAVINDANTQGGGDISFDAGFFNVPRTINMSAGGHYVLSSGITIQGPTSPSAVLTISGGNSVRIFHAFNAPWVHLKNLTLANGHEPTSHGGALLVTMFQCAAVENCVIRDCAGYTGGGIECGGKLHLFNSTVRNCSATVHGAGLRVFRGCARVVRCCFSGNVATSSGGGMAFVDGEGSVENCTFSGNVAYYAGGVFVNLDSMLRLSRCTITANVGRAFAGGLLADSPEALVKLDQCIIAGNTSISEPDIILISTPTANHNLIGITTASIPHGTNGNLGGSAASPLNARLGPLANNGGPTQTHALLCGSPAIDAGLAPAGAVDQRGLARNLGNADLGAYELMPETYAYWQGYTFPAGAANTGSTQDHDGDGVANGLEFATGSDATNRASRPVITPKVVGANFLVEFPVSPLLPSNFSVMKTSTNLTTWSVVGAANFSEIGCTAEGNKLLRATIPRLGRPRLFARLELLP